MTTPPVAHKPARVRHRVPKTKRSLVAPNATIEFNYPPDITGLIGGYLNASTYNQPVEVTFKVPTEVINGLDEFGITVDGKSVVSGVSFDPDTDATMTIPAGEFPTERDASNPYRVFVVINQADSGTVSSNVREVMVDITPPSGGYLLSAIEFADVAENGTLTPVMLDAMQGVLTGKIGGYLGLMPNDKVQAYMGETKSGAEIVISDAAAKAGKTIDLTFDSVILAEATAEELTDFSYTVTDAAGNVPVRSPLRKIYVNLSGAPADLEEPLVPAFDDDVDSKLVDEADARNAEGLQVDIPLYTNARKGDEVILKWGGQSVQPVALTEDDITHDPMVSIFLKYETIFAESGTQPNPHDVAVAFGIRRSGIDQGTSKEHPVTVDLTQAGGPDPEPLTPENENLGLPTAMGVSNVANVITAADAEGVIKVLIPTKTAGDPLVNALEEGDLIDIWWRTEKVYEAFPVVADALLLNSIEVSLLPKAIVDISGGEKVPVYYTASRLLSDKLTRNESMSPKQEVNVSSVADLPGKGALGEGTYPISRPRPSFDNILAYIMYHGGKPTVGDSYPNLGHFEFKIPEYANMAEGDVITVKVEGYLPMTRAHDDVTGNVSHEHEYVLTVKEADKGKPIVCEIHNDVGDDFLGDEPPVGSSKTRVFGGRTSYVITNSYGSVISEAMHIDYDMREPDPDA